MPPDINNNIGCFNCGWYDFSQDNGRHYRNKDGYDGDGYERLLTAVFKPKALTTHWNYKQPDANKKA